MENFGKFMTIVIALFMSFVFNGLVIMKLWMWFITPIFNINSINLIEAIGLFVIVGFFRSHNNIDYSKYKKKDQYWKSVKDTFINIIVKGGLALLFGWILQMLL